MLLGYSDYQIYLLLSCAPVQGHVAGIVDVRGLPTGDDTRIIFADLGSHSRFPTLARLWASRWTSSTLTFRRTRLFRRRTWVAAPSLARRRFRTLRLPMVFVTRSTLMEDIPTRSKLRKQSLGLLMSCLFFSFCSLSSRTNNQFQTTFVIGERLCSLISAT